MASFLATGGFEFSLFQNATCMLLFLHSAFMLSVVKMLLKREVGDCELNSHGNYIIDHGKSWKNHGIVFLNFCGNPDMGLDARKPDFVVCEQQRHRPVCVYDQHLCYLLSGKYSYCSQNCAI